MRGWPVLAWMVGCDPADAESKDTGGGVDSDFVGTDSGTDRDDTGDCTPSVWYRDADGDGFGDHEVPIEACDAPDGYVADPSDCDDAHRNAYVGAPERLTDGVDENCDGTYSVTKISDLPGWSVVGSEPDSAWFGATLAMPGDLNADGFDDLLMGTAEGSGDGLGREGAALVFYGPLGSSDVAATVRDADSVLYGGPLELAEHVCGPGDVDGDGLGEVIVSSPYFADDLDAGVAYLAFGPLPDVLNLPAEVRTFRGEYEGAMLGLCASPGDVSGDGLADVVLSASDHYSRISREGSVYILRGPAPQTSLADADTILRGTGFSEYIGASLADVGDVNGDGQHDLGIANAETETRDGLATYLVTEFPLGIMHPRDVGAIVQYDRSGAGLAKVMMPSGVGDVTGDGYDDVAFGVDRSSQSAVMAILAGPFDNTQRIDLTTEYDIGLVSGGGGLYTQLSFAASAGDWDGDGTGDLIVANSQFTPEELRDTYECSLENIGCRYGAVFIKAGPIAFGDYDIEREADRVEGVFAGGELGQAIVGGSDLNADGFPDLAVGAPDAEVDYKSQAGIAYVLFGGGSP